MSAYEAPTLRGVIRTHRGISAAVGGVVLAAVILTALITILGSSAGTSPLADSSTCSQWSAATRAQQMAFSRQYIGAHGDRGFLTVPAVTSAIRTACVTAAYLGESDDMSVVAAIKHAF